ncbi:hypothetical protein StoSoilB13_35760 (plasmid) [Arthrobacter sp. StoSoilB13]|nr:hypothetical protein StoSoilB13_35760 [Arthrobacter sp. StoSoilB13]
MNRARTNPAAKCPAVLPKDRAPLRMLLLLSCRAVTPSEMYWSIWSAVRCRGAGRQPVLDLLDSCQRLGPKLPES